MHNSGLKWRRSNVYALSIILCRLCLQILQVGLNETAALNTNTNTIARQNTNTLTIQLKLQGQIQ